MHSGDDECMSSTVGWHATVEMSLRAADTVGSSLRGHAILVIGDATESFPPTLSDLDEVSCPFGVVVFLCGQCGDCSRKTASRANGQWGDDV